MISGLLSWFELKLELIPTVKLIFGIKETCNQAATEDGRSKDISRKKTQNLVKSIDSRLNLLIDTVHTQNTLFM